MTFKLSRRDEFPEAMANHIFRYVYGQMFLSIMHVKRESNHFWNDHRSARPRLYRAFFAESACALNFLQQMMVHKGAFFQ